MTFHVQGLERHEQPNPYGYDEAAKAQKQRWLKELYPDVNALWREWVYDLCVNTPPDELEAMKRRVEASGQSLSRALSKGCLLTHKDATQTW